MSISEGSSGEPRACWRDGKDRPGGWKGAGEHILDLEAKMTSRVTGMEKQRLKGRFWWGVGR